VANKGVGALGTILYQKTSRRKDLSSLFSQIYVGEIVVHEW
jgi:hypothetical protein